MVKIKTKTSKIEIDSDFKADIFLELTEQGLQHAHFTIKSNVGLCLQHKNSTLYCTQNVRENGFFQFHFLPQSQFSKPEVMERLHNSMPQWALSPLFEAVGDSCIRLSIHP